MKKNIVFMIFLCLALNFAGCSSKDPIVESNNNNLKLAEDFTLKDLTGDEITLSKLKGKKVFLNFWATWCPPCVKEMPYMEEIHNMKIEDFVVIAINSGESNSAVQTFVDKQGFSFKVLLDKNGSLSGRYNISSIPKSIFINKEGYIVDEHVGSMNKEDMEMYIKKLDS